MPDQPQAVAKSTLIHYSPTAQTGGRAVCGTIAPADGELAGITANFGMVTCFACRASSKFKAAQRGVEPPTPPVKLSGVMADDEHLTALAGQAVTAAAKNHRGMFVIEEVIHHGEYRSQRYVEVYAINDITVEAVLTSSAYCYTGMAQTALLGGLVDDLKHGRTNRSIGWSTFRLITEH